MTEHFEVTEEYEGERIDKYLTAQLDTLTRSYLQKLIKSGGILVNSSPVKSSYPVVCGDSVSAEIPPAMEPEILAENIPLDVVYEDEDVILVNKPKGMVVHPAPCHYTGTLVNALMYHCRGQLSGINGVLRPGIVHRIDKDTTGILIACKNDLAHNKIAEALKEHSITREYRAVVYGNLKDEEGSINAPIGRHPTQRLKMAVAARGGRHAVTHYKVLEAFQGYSYIACRLETGRTHQIRVHMSSIGHPLVGDELYGPAKCPFSGLKGQTLHAESLGFVHPRTNEYMEFHAPLPAYFQSLLEKLRN